MKEGFKYYALPTKGLVGKKAIEKLVFPIFLMLAVLQFLLIVTLKKPRAVVGTGGYASFVPLFVGILFRIPTLISEQDSYPGFTTRMLSRYVTQVHIAHRKAGLFLKAKKLYVTGNPIRNKIFDGTRAEAIDYFELSKTKKTVLILGGSHGARSINKVFSEIFKEHSFPGKQFILQTGDTDFNWVKESLQGAKAEVRILPFIEKMNLAYAAADLVFSRAGALATAEITATGIPSVLIPYPFAASGHQEENARRLERIGASVVLLDKNLSTDAVFDLINSFFSDTGRLEKMHNAAISSCKRNAAKKIATHVLSISRSGGSCVQKC